MKMLNKYVGIFYFLMLSLGGPARISSADTVLLSDDFSSTTRIWSPLWARQAGKVTSGYDSNGYQGTRSLVIHSKSSQDWSYQSNLMISVNDGDVFSFSVAGKTIGQSMDASVGIVLYNSKKKVIDWNYAITSVKAPAWTLQTRRFSVTSDVKFICLRVNGYGVGDSYFDNISLIKESAAITTTSPVLSSTSPSTTTSTSTSTATAPSTSTTSTTTSSTTTTAPAATSPVVTNSVTTTAAQQDQYVLESSTLKYTLTISSRLMTILDKRTNKAWTASFATYGATIKSVTQDSSGLLLNAVDPAYAGAFTTKISLDTTLPEILFELSAKSGVPMGNLFFPPAVDIVSTDELVLPLQEGIKFPVSLATTDMPDEIRYGGSWPLPIAGIQRGGAAWMEIVETPNDFALMKSTGTGKLLMLNAWLGEKGLFGPGRRIRYVFMDKGNYVTMAKRYRQFATTQNQFMTLMNKNPLRKGNIDRLIGAVNIWYWGPDPVILGQDLKSSGVSKVLMSSVYPDKVPAINDLGYLSSRYDIYQDVWPTGTPVADLTTDGWPDDLVLDSSGTRVPGWIVEDNGVEYIGGIICSQPGLARAKAAISSELAKVAYQARFLDTTTAAGGIECYNPLHPETRSQDLDYKMKLLGFVSGDMGLVTGSEDGMASAAVVADYFEGMMSPHLGRLPGSGEGVGNVSVVTPSLNFMRYQVGETYRIPLWDLVFHGGTVSTWYWDESNNRIPDVWWRKDLFNILYGNMPLWAIRDWTHWKSLKTTFVASYKNVGPVFEKVGYEEMLSHESLTADNSVQQTTFSNNIQIIVNFGTTSFTVPLSGASVSPKGYMVLVNGIIWKSGVCNY